MPTAVAAPLLVYFSSVSGNTARFVDKLGLPARRIPLHSGPHSSEPPLRVDEPFVLVTPTYGGGQGRGAEKGSVPKQVIRFLNDEDYHGGFEEGEIEKVFSAMEANYEAWVQGYAPLAVGADVPEAVREFSRTLFNMRPDISLFVSRTVFNSDLRGVLGLVRVPSCVIQTAKDVSVPASVAEYLRAHLGGHTTVETLKTEGHLPHLSAPAQLAQFLRRALPR